MPKCLTKGHINSSGRQHYLTLLLGNFQQNTPHAFSRYRKSNGKGKEELRVIKPWNWQQNKRLSGKLLGEVACFPVSKPIFQLLATNFQTVSAAKTESLFRCSVVLIVLIDSCSGSSAAKNATMPSNSFSIGYLSNFWKVMFIEFPLSHSKNKWENLFQD